jgi:hypothetical protein
VLLPLAVREGIVSGEVDLAFRRWRRPTVKAGGTLRTPVGVLAIDAVDVIEPEEITDTDARRAGHRSREEALAKLRSEGTLYRIRFHLAGPDPRIALREDADIGPAERRRIEARYPWARDVLQLIADQPATLAADLAAQQGREKLPFKRDVRKLKELGLTESLPTGYRLSLRGRAFLGLKSARGGVAGKDSPA